MSNPETTKCPTCNQIGRHASSCSDQNPLLQGGYTQEEIDKMVKSHEKVWGKTETTTRTEVLMDIFMFLLSAWMIYFSDTQAQSAAFGFFCGGNLVFALADYKDYLTQKLEVVRNSRSQDGFIRGILWEKEQARKFKEMDNEGRT